MATITDQQIQEYREWITEQIQTGNVEIVVQDYDDNYDYDHEVAEDAVDEAYCYTCGGRGFIVTCWDDLCQDGCIHGDGDEPCPDCDNWM